MSAYSKLIGSLAGGVLGYAVTNGLLPAEWSSPETVSAITTLICMIGTFFAPANKA